MVKIICATKLTDVKGDEIPLTVGEFLSEMMWNARENQARGFVLAKKFATTEEVELKSEDVVFIKKTITALSTRAGEGGQVLEMLEPSAS